MIKYIFIFFLGMCGVAQAQNQVITSAGQTDKNTNYSINWSIGNVLTGLSKTHQYIVYEGAPTDVYKIIYPENNTLQINCYPNPTINNRFDLHILSTDINGLLWEIYTLNGNKVKTGSILNEITNINIGGLSNSLYILNIIDSNQNIVATSKILKQ